MYIWVFSRSVGAGSAMTRNTRGLTRSVMALIVPPLPAPSRPSKMTQTFAPVAWTHCCSFTSSTCCLVSSASYSLRFGPLVCDFRPSGLWLLSAGVLLLPMAGPLDGFLDLRSLILPHLARHERNVTVIDCGWADEACQSCALNKG